MSNSKNNIEKLRKNGIISDEAYEIRRKKIEEKLIDEVKSNDQTIDQLIKKSNPGVKRSHFFLIGFQ